MCTVAYSVLILFCIDDLKFSDIYRWACQLSAVNNIVNVHTGMGSHSLCQGNLLDPGIEPASPALQVDSSPSEPPGKPILNTTLMCFLGGSWPSRGGGKLQLWTTYNRERLGSSTRTIGQAQHFSLPLSGMMLSFVLWFVQFLCLIKWGQSH